MKGVLTRRDRPERVVAARVVAGGCTRGVVVFAMRGVAGMGRQVAVAPLQES